MKYIILFIPLIFSTSCYFTSNENNTWSYDIQYEYDEIAYIDTMCQKIMKNPEKFQKIIDSDDRFFHFDTLHAPYWNPKIYDYFHKYEFELCAFDISKGYLMPEKYLSYELQGRMLYKAKKYKIIAYFSIGEEHGKVYFHIIDVREQRRCKEWNPYID